MVARESERLFAKDAELRMKAGKKTDPEATVPQGSARALAAAVVGVSPRMITSAKKVADEGAPELSQAVRDGSVSLSVAERLVRRVPDKKRQAGIVERSVRCSSPRDNDKLVKREMAASERRSEAQKPRTRDLAGATAVWQLRANIRGIANSFRVLERQCGDDGVLRPLLEDYGDSLVADFEAAQKALNKLAAVLQVIEEWDDELAVEVAK